MATAKKSRGKKAKRADDRRPARARYWDGRHLERNKVKRIMRATGMTKAEATVFWLDRRKKRIKTRN